MGYLVINDCPIIAWHRQKLWKEMPESNTVPFRQQSRPSIYFRSIWSGTQLQAWMESAVDTLFLLLNRILSLSLRARSCRQHTSYTIIFSCFPFYTFSDCRHERIQSKCLFALVCRPTETEPERERERVERAERENTVNVINEYETHCCERKNTQMFIIVAVVKNRAAAEAVVVVVLGCGFVFAVSFPLHSGVCTYVCVLAKKQQLLFMASFDSLYFILTLFLPLTLEIGDVEYCFGAFSTDGANVRATLPPAQMPDTPHKMPR